MPAPVTPCAAAGKWGDNNIAAAATTDARIRFLADTERYNALSASSPQALREHLQVVRSVPFIPFGKMPPPDTPARSVRYTIRSTCCGVLLKAFPSASDGTMLARPPTAMP